MPVAFSATRDKILEDLSEGNELTKREQARRDEFYARVKACIPKKEGHVQKPDPEEDGKRLYTVTTLACLPRYGGDRTPVVCDNFEDAKAIVEMNMGDIYETSYQLVVIEAVRPNYLYGGDLHEQYWYRWEGDYESGRYKPIEVPLDYENTVGFGIG